MFVIMPKFIDLTGRKIGRLSVASRSDRRPRAWWNCKCDCGNECVVSGVFLKESPSPSCGCYATESYGKHVIKHGHAPSANRAQSRTYATWRGMKLRCLNPNHSAFKDYGARGISICDRWMDFNNFLQDMGEKPDGLELDRKDTNGNYCRENCEWVTHSKNCRNMRSNFVLEMDGHRLCLAEWAERYGIEWHTVYQRIKRGWSVANALTKPAAKNSEKPTI